jgi:hypothetical protein
VNNPFDVKENHEHALSFAEPSMSFKHPSTADAIFTERSSNHFRISVTLFSEICTKFDAHSLSNPS